MTAKNEWDEKPKSRRRMDDDDDDRKKPQKKGFSPLGNIIAGVGLIVLGVGGTIFTVVVMGYIFYALPIAAVIGLWMCGKGLVGLVSGG